MAVACSRYPVYFRQEMTDAPKFSFTFSKQKKPLKPSSTAADVTAVQKKKESLKEYVTSIENNVIQ